jgi:hypothetical protein
MMPSMSVARPRSTVQPTVTSSVPMPDLKQLSSDTIGNHIAGKTGIRLDVSLDYKVHFGSTQTIPMQVQLKIVEVIAFYSDWIEEMDRKRANRRPLEKLGDKRNLKFSDEAFCLNQRRKQNKTEFTVSGEDGKLFKCPHCTRGKWSPKEQCYTSTVCIASVTKSADERYFWLLPCEDPGPGVGKGQTEYWLGPDC